MTLKKAFLYGKQLLEEAGIADAGTDCWILLEYLTGCTRNDYYLRAEEWELTDAQKIKWQEILKKRAEHIPVQHLCGEQEFMGLPFRVSPDVLVPRQDTEILVEEVIKLLKPGMKLLDLCTGSGCILVSLLKFAENCTGTGTDISAGALAVAEQNAAANGVQAAFIRSDLFENIRGTFDIIVSNPPYIATEEVEKLAAEVRDHEPRQALDGGEDGLFFYREIVRESKKYLKKNGWLCFEIGFDQGAAVSEMMRDAGYDSVCVKQDLAGLDRIVTGILQEE